MLKKLIRAARAVIVDFDDSYAAAYPVKLERRIKQVYDSLAELRYFGFVFAIA